MMVDVWRPAVIVVCVVVAAVWGQEVHHRRQMNSEGHRGGGVRLVGLQQLHRTHHNTAAGGVGAGGGMDVGDVIRPLTREERRRLREERRQARMERREERRRQKQDSRRAHDMSEVASVDEIGEEEVVDVAWLRANLSSLWQEFRAFTDRVQGFRGGGRGRGRGHFVNQVEMEEEDHTCPTGVESCTGDDGQVCSSHGQCWCGHCQCEEEYYGSFCQCSDHTCQLYDGMPCGGPSRGQCRCGGCMCRPGYVGESCGCPTHTHTCRPEGHEGAHICSNKGTCECGRCSCEDGYKGMYCEDTVYAAGVCEKLRSCVLCVAYHRDLPRCHQCQVVLEVVDSLEPSMTTCVMVNSGCIMKYSYVALPDNAYSVMLQRNQECPPQIE